MTELVSHKNDHSKELAEYISSNEVLGDAATRRDFFENMDENDFLDMTQKVASLIRTGSDADQQHFDGDVVGLMFHEVPDQREKEALLRETWATAQRLLKNRTLSDEDSLEYAAMTVAGGILYTHPFIDGNGRTSRVMSYLLSQGSADEEELRAMTTQTGDNSWYVTPIGIIAERSYSYGGHQPEKIEWEWHFAGEGTDALDGLVVNSRYKVRAIRTFIEVQGDKCKEILDKYITVDDEGNHILDGDKFLEAVVTTPGEGMGNALFIKNSIRESRADYVHRYLEAMQSNNAIEPDEITPEDFVPSESESEFVKNRRKLLIREFSKRALDGKLTPRDQEVIRHRIHSTIHHKKAA